MATDVKVPIQQLKGGDDGCRQMPETQPLITDCCLNKLISKKGPKKNVVDWDVRGPMWGKVDVRRWRDAKAAAHWRIGGVTGRLTPA